MAVEPCCVPRVCIPRRDRARVRGVARDGRSLVLAVATGLRCSLTPVAEHGWPRPGQRTADQSPARTFTVRAACPHDCPDTCAMLVTVEQRDGGRVATKIAGDPDHPTTHGTLCTKVARYLERVYHHDRLLHPLKRVGPKGKGAFERVSWDEALDDIAKRLGASPPSTRSASCRTSYAGTMGLVQGESMAQRFFNRLGASLLDRTICAQAGAEALNYTLGTRIGTDDRAVPEREADHLLGHERDRVEPASVDVARRKRSAAARSSIAIDPYRSLTAEKCHEHIALLPGTDARARARAHARARARGLARRRLHRALHARRRRAARARSRAFTPAARGRALRHRGRGDREPRARLLRRFGPPRFA